MSDSSALKEHTTKMDTRNLSTSTPVVLLLAAAAAFFLSSCAQLQPAKPKPAPAPPQTAQKPSPPPEPPPPKPRALYQWYGDGRTVSHIEVDVDEQKAVFYDGPHQIGWTMVASGVRANPTPTGRFAVTEKIVDKRSNLYGKIYNSRGKLVRRNAERGVHPVPAGGRFEGAKMPYFMRLTNDGIGMHAGPIPKPGRPASHGCIRMPYEMAPILYRHVALGTPVSIVGSGPSYGKYLASQRRKVKRGAPSARPEGAETVASSTAPAASGAAATTVAASTGQDQSAVPGADIPTAPAAVSVDASSASPAAGDIASAPGVGEGESMAGTTTGSALAETSGATPEPQASDVPPPIGPASTPVDPMAGTQVTESVTPEPQAGPDIPAGAAPVPADAQTPNPAPQAETASISDAPTGAETSSPAAQPVTAPPAPAAMPSPTPTVPPQQVQATDSVGGMAGMSMGTSNATVTTPIAAPATETQGDG
jgi:lipoprotein-anchoring transpeptidase ErfK/SrfK